MFKPSFAAHRRASRWFAVGGDRPAIAEPPHIANTLAERARSSILVGSVCGEAQRS